MARSASWPTIVFVVACGWSLAWIFTYVGTIARSAQSVQGISLMILFPLTFLSNAFVPTGTMPDWLQTFVNINPVSHIVTASRDLANNGHVERRRGVGAARVRRHHRGVRAAVGAVVQAQDVRSARRRRAGAPYGAPACRRGTGELRDETLSVVAELGRAEADGLDP